MVGIGSTIQFSAVGRNAAGKMVKDAEILWRSLNPFVATIDATGGVATAQSSGQVTIVAETDGAVGYALLTISVEETHRVVRWEITKTLGDPLPHFESVWGSSSDDVFAVARDGIIFRFDGTCWGPMDSGTTNSLTGIWGVAPDDIFLVGINTRLRFDGTEWKPMAVQIGYFYGVGGVSSSTVFALGLWGRIDLFNGEEWIYGNLDSDTHFKGIWGSAPDNFLAVGPHLGAPHQGGWGDIFRWDGTGWTLEHVADRELFGIWGASENDVFAVGDEVILHFDGDEWTTKGHPGFYLKKISGRSPNDIYAVGWDAVRREGVVLHYDGASWSPTYSGTSRYLLSVWTAPDGEVFAVGSDGTIVHFDGDRWETMRLGRLSGAWGATADEVYVAGCAPRVMRGSSRTWAPMTLKMGGELEAVWGTSGTDYHTAGADGWVLHFQETGWSGEQVTPGTDLHGIWGSSPEDIFVVGGRGAIAHFDGSEWRKQTSGTTADLQDLWGVSAERVFAVGRAGTILSFDGQRWTPMISGTQADLHGVWGTSSNDVYAVGSGGVILKYDGSSWSAMSGVDDGDLYGISGAGSQHIYAVGAGGRILHFKGDEGWVALSHAVLTGFNEDLFGVWTTDFGEVVVVGNGPFILRGPR